MSWKRKNPRWRRTNRHHLIPRSRGGQDGPENVIVIDERWHAALHMVFGTALPRDYLLLASTDPERYAARWVRSLVHHFGEDVLTQRD